MAAPSRPARHLRWPKTCGGPLSASEGAVPDALLWNKKLTDISARRRLPSCIVRPMSSCKVDRELESYEHALQP